MFTRRSFLQSGAATAALAASVSSGHAAALEFATAFVEDAKRSRLMRRIFDANGLQDQAVAP